MTAARLGLAAPGAQGVCWFGDPKRGAHGDTGLASGSVLPRACGLDQSPRAPRAAAGPERGGFRTKPGQGHVSEESGVTGARGGRPRLWPELSYGSSLSGFVN